MSVKQPTSKTQCLIQFVKFSILRHVSPSSKHVDDHEDEESEQVKVVLHRKEDGEDEEKQQDLPVRNAGDEFAPGKVFDFAHDLINFRLILGSEGLKGFLAPIVVEAVGKRGGGREGTERGGRRGERRYGGGRSEGKRGR